MCRGVNLIIFEKHFRYRVNAPPIAISRAFSRTRKNNLEHIHMGYIKKKINISLNIANIYLLYFRGSAHQKRSNVIVSSGDTIVVTVLLEKRLKTIWMIKHYILQERKKQNKTIGVHLTLTVSNSVWIASFSSNLHSLQRISNDEVHSLS